MKKYMSLWIFCFVLVGFEYYALNFHTHLSILTKLQAKGLIRDTLEVSPVPGRAVSLWLGWIGLSLMLIMNLYSMRKRFRFMQSWGKLSDWLNFHVFCGLLGPTFILFHCNFKVRGIVAISFWSMVVSFTSGIIGRYFYVQMLREKNFFDTEAERIDAKIKRNLERAKITLTAEEDVSYKNLALAYAGLPPEDAEQINPFTALASALAGDIRLSLKPPPVPKAWPQNIKYLLAGYAVNKRRAAFLLPFQKLMGYWHAFHFPFAVFMYVVAVIHVLAALVLGV